MFKQILAILSIGSILGSQAAAQQASQPGPDPTTTVKVHKHTALKFATVQPLDSATAKVGDDVPLRLVNPLMVDGVTVLAAGEVVHGQVIKVSKASPKCHNGEVKWNLDKIALPDSTTVTTKVQTVDSSPDAYVPAAYTPQRFHFDWGESDIPTGTWWQIILAIPLLGFEIICYSPLLVAVALILPFSYLWPETCTTPTKEYQLPANATVGVEITNDYELEVSYQ